MRTGCACTVLRTRLVLAPRRHAQTSAEFYKGKTDRGAISAPAPAAATTPMRACCRATWAATFPAIRASCRRTWRAAAASGSPISSTTPRPRTGWSSARINRGVAFDPLLGNKAAQFDATQVQLDRLAPTTRSSICVAWHTTGVERYQQVLEQRARGRRVRHRRRHLSVSQDRQRRARHQVQDRHRLSRRQRHRPRDGAPGGAGPLRLVVVEREGHASDLAAGEEVQHPVPDGAVEASRAAGRRR